MPAQPQDHKKPADTPFVWTAPNGKKVTLKPFDRIPAGVFRKFKDENDMQQAFALLEACTDAKGLAVIDDLPFGDLESLFAEWAEAAGVTPGES